MEAIKIDNFPEKIVTREDILNLENSIRSLCEPEPELPIKHYFAPGLYAREMLIPAGAVVVGKIHKHAHVNNISKGRVKVSTEFGSEEFVAPYQFISKPGTKRAVCALEDTIWTTYHPTNETDLEKIEEEVIAKSYDEYDNFRLPKAVIMEVLP